MTWLWFLLMKENFFRDIEIVNANIGYDEIVTTNGKSFLYRYWDYFFQKTSNYALQFR